MVVSRPKIGYTRVSFVLFLLFRTTYCKIRQCGSVLTCLSVPSSPKFCMKSYFISLDVDVVVPDKKIFKVFISKIYFSLCDLDMQRT